MKKLLLIKAASIPEGAHWITVHPNGAGTGQPVLIQPQSDGSAKVIGGAGGSLNHLRLRGVKSKDKYKEEATAKADETRQKKKEQTAADKASGVHEAKQLAKQQVAQAKKVAERHVIEAVAKKAVWDKSELEFPEADYAHLSSKALEKVRDRHHANLLAKAKTVIKQSRERLVSDSAAREEAGIGEVPLFSDAPEALSVQDLDPVGSKKASLGFQADYKGRSEASGLSPEALQHEAQQHKLETMSESQRKAAFARGQAAALIKQELAGIQEPAAPKADASLLSAKDALELVKEGRKLALIEKAAQKANAKIDKGAAEPKAFVVESDSADLDEAAKEAVINDLRTAQTVAFLSEVGSIAGGDPTETLGGHIGVGAYNSINSLALAVGGEALVDRSVVDVLGIAGAAQILARRLHSDLSGEEIKHVADGVQDWHLNHYMQASTDALKKSRELTDAAKAIEVSADAVNGADLEVAQELNKRRRNAIGDAQRILGQALGEMESNAALVMSMKQGRQDSIQVSLGKTNAEAAIQQLHALGLQKGDYTLEKVAGDRFVTVNAAGMDRLAKPVNRADVQQVKRNLAIARGDHDEDGWLPLGVANRRDLAMDVKPGVAERFAMPWQPGENLVGDLKSYIGARAADGDAPADILADIQSAEFFNRVGTDRAGEYRAALDAVAPLKGEDGKMQRVESLADHFDKLADEHVASLGGDRSTLNKQALKIDDKSMEALHRALSSTPEGVSAYKQIGDLDHKDQRSLREFFSSEIAKSSPEGDKLKADQSSLTWGKYIKVMGGNAQAYEAVQDVIRSRVSGKFAEAHNRLNPDSPLKLGKTIIRNNLQHLDAVSPEAREARLSKQKALIDSMRERSDGKYAIGSVSDKLASQSEQKAAYEQSQMGFFSSEEAPVGDAGPGEDERHTLGHVAEGQIAGMMGIVGKNFKPGQPAKLWNISMSGKYAPQQRAIKLVEANKRVVLAAGAGSGKTNMMLGAHAHLASQGKIKRSLMLVPSIVQGQFNGEALRLLEPGKFKTHIQPGASQAERIAAYKDPDTNICVMTHQSFRDDLVHLGSQHEGIDHDAMTAKIQTMTPAERRDWAAGVMAKEGINFDASMVDEAHDTLNRAGKENSSLANVVEAVGHHTPYHVYASGDPIKNDPSEIHSMLQKMDMERYGDRNEFMRKYGADTIASKQALKRELSRYMFPTAITPDVARDRRVEKVSLSAGQQSALKNLNNQFSMAKAAKRSGKVDIEAAKAISPNSFNGVPESEHEKVAESIQNSLGIIKNSAVSRIINSHPDNAKVARAVELVKEREGKQGVIFARNRDSVEQYKAAMEAAGKRVVTITGSDSAKDKDAKRRLFNPESGEAKADILIASDAGAVGMNLQSGHYLIQHDVSQTAKTHSQRNARIDRIGQKNQIELIDLVADHKDEYAARDRLTKKYGLKDMMADPMDGLDDTGVAGAISARFKAAQAGENEGAH